MNSRGKTRILLNKWLQTGKTDALNSLVEEFSASLKAQDNDGPSVFKEFLLGLRVTEDVSQTDGMEHEAIEPIYDFTGYV